MKICLVGAYSDGLLGRTTGGAERQIAMLARAFAGRGHRVTLLALEHEGADVEVEGISVRGAWDPSRGVRWVRAVTFRRRSLRRVLTEIDADLYYVRGAMAYSHLVVTVGHRLDAPTLLGLASDRDLTPDSGRVIAELGDSLPEKAMSQALWLALQRRALHEADAVIAQNAAQASACARMGLPHVMIPSIVATPPKDLLDCDRVYDVVWAGNVTGPGRRKGVTELAELVAALPDVRFAIMGALTDASVAAEVARLEALPNATILGMVEHAEAQRCIAQSALVLNTSPTEGFSNVMLEGWSLGRPALTLSVNPNDLLAAGRWPLSDSSGRGPARPLGACAGGDTGLLARLIGDALGDEASLRDIGRRCREYVAASHGADAVVTRYEDVAAGVRQ
jgi:glycosyltransferase involved in cell wall biosynthesis